MLRNVVAANQGEVARVDATIATTREGLAAAQARLEALTPRRRFRHPNQHAINETHHRIHAHRRYLGRLHDERTGWAGQLERSRRRLHRRRACGGPYPGR